MALHTAISAVCRVGITGLRGRRGALSHTMEGVPRSLGLTVSRQTNFASVLYANGYADAVQRSALRTTPSKDGNPYCERAHPPSSSKRPCPGGPPKSAPREAVV